ncbi:hypothetical protein QYF61_018222, partial [Mycteria americana]
MGRPGRLIISHSHKPTKASTMCSPWWKQPPDGWKHIPCPMGNISHAPCHHPTILGLEKQLLWRHGTPERMESDNGTHFRNNFIDTWANEHGIEWIYHIPYHAPASRKFKRYNGLLKTTLRALGAGMFKHWDTHLAKATWLVNTRGSANQADLAQSKLLRIVEGDKVPVVHIKNMLGKKVWVTPALGKGTPIHSLPHPSGGRVSERLRGAWLPTGAKPRHSLEYSVTSDRSVAKANVISQQHPTPGPREQFLAEIKSCKFESPKQFHPLHLTKPQRSGETGQQLPHASLQEEQVAQGK